MNHWKQQIAGFCAVAISFTSAAIAQDASSAKGPVQGRAMIVLDASGSMLASIKGEKKIDIARKALDDLLND